MININACRLPLIQIRINIILSLQENTFLHCQFNPSHRPHFIPLRARILLARRGWREGYLRWVYFEETFPHKKEIGYLITSRLFHHRHQHSPVTCRVPAARVKDSPAHLTRPTAHRQIPALHLHHEHSLHPGYRRHHQLELQVRVQTCPIVLGACPSLS